MCRTRQRSRRRGGPDRRPGRGPGFCSGAHGWTTVILSPGRYELGWNVAPATTCLACTPNSTSPVYPVSSHFGIDQRRLGYGHID